MRRFFPGADQAKRAFLPGSLFQRVWTVLLAVTAATYLLVSFVSGGDAFHGRELTGHFYVAHHNGAPMREVGAAAFFVSLWSLRVLFALWLIGLIAAIRYYFGRKRQGLA